MTDTGSRTSRERPFPNDGWSGARLTQLQRRGRRFVLKRTSWATDWIVRATDDRSIREAEIATAELPFPDAVAAPYVGAASDGDAAALLAPNLTGILFDWKRPLSVVDLDRLIGRIAALHAGPWPAAIESAVGWCPLPERLASPVAPGRRTVSGRGQRSR